MRNELFNLISFLVTKEKKKKKPNRKQNTKVLSGMHTEIFAGKNVSIPGSRRSPGEGNGNPLQYPYWIPWMEEPCGLYSPWGRKESGMT